MSSLCRQGWRQKQQLAVAVSEFARSSVARATRANWSVFTASHISDRRRHRLCLVSSIVLRYFRLYFLILF